jgi:hypothetical protein
MQIKWGTVKMSDQSVTDLGQQFPLPSGGKKYTDESRTKYRLAVATYALRLRAVAEGKADAETVVEKNINSAVEELSPRTNGIKALADWVKRSASLVAGLSIMQGIKVFQPNGMVAGSVVWLLVDFGLTFLLLGVGLTLDFPDVRRLLKNTTN